MLGEHLSPGCAVVAVGLLRGRLPGGVGAVCTSVGYAEDVEGGRRGSCKLLERWDFQLWAARD